MVFSSEDKIFIKKSNTGHRRVDGAPHRCVGRAEAECHWQSYWTVAAKAAFKRRDITSNILLNVTFSVTFSYLTLDLHAFHDKLLPNYNRLSFIEDFLKVFWCFFYGAQCIYIWIYIYGIFIYIWIYHIHIYIYIWYIHIYMNIPYKSP